MAAKTILVVEDDPDIRENLRMLLEGEGFSVLEAPNGKEALSLLRSNVTPKPGLVFLDLQMPVMDGKTFLTEVASDPQLTELPVIVITAGADRFEGKMIGFMKKPLDIDQVVAAAQKYAGA